MRVTSRDVGCLVVLLVLAAVVYLVLRVTGTSLGEARDRVLGQQAAPDPRTVTVTYVFDGDTIEVQHEGRPERVRLVNIDAPETNHRDGGEPECLALEARALLEELLPRGTEVELEVGVDPVDRYGRQLAAVWHGDVLVNAEMARAGLAVPMLVRGNDLVYDDVLDAFDEAQAARAGFFDPATGCDPGWR